MKKLLFAFAYAFTLAAGTPGTLAQGEPASKPSVATSIAASVSAPTSMPFVTSAPARPADSPGASAMIIIAVLIVVIAGATLVFLRWRRG